MLRAMASEDLGLDIDIAADGSERVGRSLKRRRGLRRGVGSPLKVASVKSERSPSYKLNKSLYKE